MHFLSIPLSCYSCLQNFRHTKNSGTPHFMEFRCIKRRAIDGTRTFFSPGKPIKSRRNAHCLQNVYKAKAALHPHKYRQAHNRLAEPLQRASSQKLVFPFHFIPYHSYLYSSCLLSFIQQLTHIHNSACQSLTPISFILSFPTKITTKLPSGYS